MTLNSKSLWLHFYTNGSAQENGSDRFVFYCESLFEGSCAAVIGATAEIEAVKQAIYLLSNLTTSNRHAVFLIESQLVILTLSSLHNSYSNWGIGLKKKFMNLTLLNGSQTIPTSLAMKSGFTG